MGRVVHNDTMALPIQPNKEFAKKGGFVFDTGSGGSKIHGQASTIQKIILHSCTFSYMSCLFRNAFELKEAWKMYYNYISM